MKMARSFALISIKLPSEFWDSLNLDTFKIILNNFRCFDKD